MFRKFFYINILFIGLTCNSFGQANTPELNKKIVTYIKTVIGKQVDRGECWDIAYEALTQFNAKWDGKFVYGKLLNVEKDEIFPGDIIQFKNVKVTYKKDNVIYKETMAQHTAIVYRVFSKGKFELAHQNTGFSGRKVGLSNFDVATVVKGKIFIYRPIN